VTQTTAADEKQAPRAALRLLPWRVEAGAPRFARSSWDARPSQIVGQATRRSLASGTKMTRAGASRSGGDLDHRSVAIAEFKDAAARAAGRVVDRLEHRRAASASGRLSLARTRRGPLAGDHLHRARGLDERERPPRQLPAPTTTTDQSPSLRSQVTVCVPAPCANAAQNRWSAGRAGRPSPLRSRYSARNGEYDTVRRRPVPAGELKPIAALERDVRVGALGGSPTGSRHLWVATIPRAKGPSTKMAAIRPAGAASEPLFHVPSPW
jgi:hypothetical protein